MSNFSKTPEHFILCAKAFLLKSCPKIQTPLLSSSLNLVLIILSNQLRCKIKENKTSYHIKTYQDLNQIWLFLTTDCFEIEMSSVPSSLGLIMLIFFLSLYDQLCERTMVKSMHVIFNIFIMCVLSHSVLLTLLQPHGQ